MLKSNFEFEILVHGSPTKEYYHKGNHYIEGKEGSRFSLRMRNNSANRVLFVPTVDGLSIMDGKEGSFNSRGYIVNAHDSLTIDGWRTSNDKVAEFFFSSPKESYVKKIKKDSNLGVIGCAVFKEKVSIQVIEKIVEKYAWYTTIDSIDNNTILCYSNTASSDPSNNYKIEATVSQDLGTGFGQDKYSPVTTVSFDKEESPSEVFSLYYNTRYNLEKLGIEFRKPIYVTPSAFPNENGYCKRP